MKSFDRFLGISALVLFVVLMVSGMVAVSYVMGNPGMFNSANFRVDEDFHFSFSDTRSSDYPTLNISQQNVFEVSEINAIKLDIDFADVLYVEEDRDDILVKHYIEYPDTNNYSYTYSCNQSGDVINIRSSVRSYNLHMDLDYIQYITIYVPENMHLDVYELTSSIGSIGNDSIPSNVDLLYIEADLGDIRVDLTNHLNDLRLSADIGEIYATTTASIESLEITSPIGFVSLESSEAIHTLEIDSNIGDVYLVLGDITEYGHLEMDIASADITINGHVKEMNVDGNMGDITLTVASGNTVYAYNDSENIYTEIPLSDNDDANIDITTDIGQINIYELQTEDSDQ